MTANTLYVGDNPLMRVVFQAGPAERTTEAIRDHLVQVRARLAAFLDLHSDED